MRQASKYKEVSTRWRDVCDRVDDDAKPAQTAQIGVLVLDIVVDMGREWTRMKQEKEIL